MARETTTAARKAATGAMERSLQILDFLARAQHSSVASIGAELGLTRSTTYRLIGRLHELGWLALDPVTNEWHLGPAAARLASAAVQATGLLDAAGPVMRELLGTTQETINLTVPSGLEMKFIHRERSPRSAAVSAELGTARPFHNSSTGRAYISALPEPMLEEVLSELERSPASPIDSESLVDLRVHIATTQTRGWSSDVREFDAFTCCCGAPIYDHTGLPIAAISVSGIAERMEPEVENVGPLVQEAALKISRNLGYVGPGLQRRSTQSGLALQT